MTKLLNVLMEERDEKVAVGFFGNWAKHAAETKKKPAYDWRYENSILNGARVEVDGEYSQWRTNSVLAKHKDVVPFVNEMNINYHVTNDMHYTYMYNAVRKYKRGYNKGETKQEKAAREKEAELISLVSNYYKYNIVRAKEALRILTDEQINEIRNKQEKGGVK